MNEFLFQSPAVKGDLDERHQRIRTDVALAHAGRRRNDDHSDAPLTSGIAGVFALLRVQPRHHAA